MGVRIPAGAVYYICMEVHVSACHIYIFWVELGHYHFNLGKLPLEMGAKRVLKMELCDLVCLTSI